MSISMRPTLSTLSTMCDRACSAERAVPGSRSCTPPCPTEPRSCSRCLFLKVSTRIKYSIEQWRQIQAHGGQN